MEKKERKTKKKQNNFKKKETKKIKQAASKQKQAGTPNMYFLFGLTRPTCKQVAVSLLFFIMIIPADFSFF